MPTLKQSLWGSTFWSGGYYVNTVGRYGNESGTRRYIAAQGLPHYEPLYDGQLDLFEEASDA